MRYYRLTDDINFPDRWYLCDMHDESMKYVHLSTLHMAKLITAEISKEGVSMDFTTSDNNAIPIVTESLAKALSREKNVMFIPTIINGNHDENNYYTMVATESIDCVDEEKSEFTKFEVDDPVRPDRAGDYSGFFKLIIDKNKIVDKDIFRIEKSETRLIVSERIKNLLESEGFTGLKFKEV
ncbi:MAG: DUF1629 domain-containing protein [Bacteroidota bacterium]